MSGASPFQVDLVGVPLDATRPAFFRYRKAGEMVVLTNQDGGFVLLSPEQFLRFATGAVVEGDPLHEQLREGNFLAATYDREKAVARLRARLGFLHWGPGFHSLAVTGPGAPMTEATAEQAVALALATTSPSMTLSFRAGGTEGGDPLSNLPVIRHAVEEARRRNEQVGKELSFEVVSDLSHLTDEALAFLSDNGFAVHVSCSGAPDRPWAEGIRRIVEAGRAKGLERAVPGVEALFTVSRADLSRPREIVDSIARLGCRLLHLRPDPSLRSAEYLPFHAAVLDHLVGLAASGTPIRERRTSVFLAKILTGADPGFLGIRSPGGEGIGALAYAADGTIFASDAGMDLSETGDRTFVLGNVTTSAYREVVGHETVRAAALASNVDARPDCVNCAYGPYCGVPAAEACRTQGTIFGRMRDNELCALYKGIQDDLFSRIGRGDPGVLEVLRAWAAAESGDEAGGGGDGSSTRVP